MDAEAASSQPAGSAVSRPLAHRLSPVHRRSGARLSGGVVMGMAAGRGPVGRAIWWTSALSKQTATGYRIQPHSEQHQINLSLRPGGQEEDAKHT